MLCYLRLVVDSPGAFQTLTVYVRDFETVKVLDEVDGFVIVGRRDSICPLPKRFSFPWHDPRSSGIGFLSELRRRTSDGEGPTFRGDLIAPQTTF